MKQLLTVLSVLILASCNNTAEEKQPVAKDTPATTITPAPAPVQPTPAAETPKEQLKVSSVLDKIYDTLLTLPFVIKSNHYIDSFSHHQHGIAFMADSSEKEWFIQAGYNGDQRFETYHRFYVNPKTMEISVYDVVDDEKYSIDAYLKKEKEK